MLCHLLRTSGRFFNLQAGGCRALSKTALHAAVKARTTRGSDKGVGASVEGDADVVRGVSLPVFERHLTEQLLQQAILERVDEAPWRSKHKVCDQQQVALMSVQPAAGAAPLTRGTFCCAAAVARRGNTCDRSVTLWASGRCSPAVPGAIKTRDPLT